MTSMKKKFKRNRNKRINDVKPRLLREAITSVSKKLTAIPRTQPCAICGKPPIDINGKSTGNILALFIAGGDESHRYGGIPDRQRIIPYAICKECMALSDKGTLVEKAMISATDKMISSMSDEDFSTLPCVCCGGKPDMLHTADAGKRGAIFATCQHCRDTKGNISAIVATRLSDAQASVL
jgi:hypothetical protein